MFQDPKSRVVALAIGAVLGLMILAPLEDTAAYGTAVLCGAIGVFGLSFVRDETMRRDLMRLFCATLALRLAFTVFAYKMGLTSAGGLGGGDETMWQGMWTKSRYWAAGDVDFSNGAKRYPDSIWELYSGARGNRGYQFFGTYLFYLLDVRSQMALSFVNCFGNALTVCLVYACGREFYGRRASLFAAVVALILPAFLAWSALSQKEVWVVLFAFSTFYATVRWAKRDDWRYLPVALLSMGLIFTLRFYLAYFLVLALGLSWVCFRARRPGQAMLSAIAGLMVVYSVASGLGWVHFDLLGVAQSQIEEARAFGTSMAGGDKGSSAVGSAVVLHYDVRTPGGLAMMTLVGGTYLLLSPFPWQSLSGRQIYTLPDVLLWWSLIAWFIIPGAVYAWKQQRALLLSLVVFLLPAILIYSVGFGNIGLSYRMRAQLLPFFLMMAAAGFQWREDKRALRNPQTPLTRVLMRMQITPVPSNR